MIVASVPVPLSPYVLVIYCDDRGEARIEIVHAQLAMAVTVIPACPDIGPRLARALARFAPRGPALAAVQDLTAALETYRDSPAYRALRAGQDKP